ncbi:MAG: flippase-like domain-containing protein [Myxococcales bacterium]|nr:flippase-like domain-containing protein [Myxococcales bacterium]
MKLAAVLALTALGLLGVLWGVDLGVVRESLSAFDVRSFAVCWVCYYLTQCFRCWRLQALLGRPVGFWRLMSITSLGFLAINVLPFRMGELVRPTLLTDEGVPLGEGMATIFMERLADILMLLAFLLSVGWAVDLPPGGIIVQGTDVVAAGQRLFGVGVAVGVVGLSVVTLLGERALRITDGLPAAILVRRFVEGIRAFVLAPLRMVRVMGLTALIWVVTLVAVWATLAALPGLPSDPGAVVFVWTLTLTGLAAVPTPGFFGGFEALCVAALAVLAADPDKSRTFAVVLHLGQFAFTLTLGCFYLLKEGVTLAELRARAR